MYCSTRQFDGVQVHYESHSVYRGANSTGMNNTSNSSTPNSHNNTSGSSHNSISVNNSNSNKRSSKNTTNARNQLISVQQQELLKNHLDCITDLKITELPHPMLISGDRDGIVKVFL